jgi:hypothetical protein
VSSAWRFEKGAFLSTLPDEGDAFSLIELPVLTRWAIEGRYPGDLDEATHADGNKAIAIARQVLAVVRPRVTGHL